MRQICFVLGLAFVVASASSCLTRGFNNSATKEAPEGLNNLAQFRLNEMRYDAIPKTAKLSKTPWAGSYWPTYQGGIAVRWQTLATDSDDYHKYLYALPTASQLRALTKEQIAVLSPAEKYDLWNDRYDLTADNSITHQQREFMLAKAQFNRAMFKTDEIPTWTGICNGWSLSALREPQPVRAFEVKNAAGQVIKFFPDDVKALVSQLYNDFQFQNKTNIMGLSEEGKMELVKGFSISLGAACSRDKGDEVAKDGMLVVQKDSKGRPVKLKCRDVNPKSFHATLAQFIAKDKPFVFDVESRDQIWNQPVAGYRITKLGTPRPITSAYTHAAEGTTQLVDVVVELDYIVEAAPHVPAYTETKEFTRTEVYKYTLELGPSPSHQTDDNQIVLGGEWAADSRMPDFMWVPQFDMDDSLFDAGYPMTYGKMSQLIKLAAGGAQGTASDNAPTQPVQNPTSQPPVVTQPVEPPAPPFISVSTAAASPFDLAVVSGVRTGMKVNTDSGTVITRLGANMLNTNMIRLQNISFDNSSASQVKFRSSKAATVLVAVDKRATNDTWLTKRGFVRSNDPGFEVATNFVPASPYIIYSKAIAAGADVDLPGQFIDGETGAGRNYVVFVRD